MKKVFLICILLFIAFFVSTCKPGASDGEYELHILSTNDVHGTWFDYDYVMDVQVEKNSILSLNTLIQKFRDSVGKDNVVLVDAGDCLQGDNAPYYFNYIDTLSPHLFARIAEYMKYDAIAVGNHDIETGHPVYDRVRKDLEDRGIPFLAANALRNKDNKPYFKPYTIVKRGGLKVAILGYTNPNMKAWLDESLWSGMHFESLIPMVQNDVDRVRKVEKPDVVLVVAHSGVGEGDGEILESQGMDLFNSLRGVDFLICSHDHKAFVAQNDSICLLNSGSHSRNIAHGVLKMTIKRNKIKSKSISVEIIENNVPADSAMRSFFHDDYLKIRKFTTTPVGELSMDISTRDAFTGMSDYMNLIHTVGLVATNADISIAAPLSYNKEIKAGEILYNDLFTFYPYENQLYVISMTGKEIKDYLEYSYDGWISTDSPDHLLKIQKRDDLRYSQKGWSFVNRSYNFDSAAGIFYTVDTKKNRGERINIISMANGAPFSMDKSYDVAITSYRASGGGELLQKGAGIAPDKIAERIKERYSEYRDLIYKYILKSGPITHEKISGERIIGGWKFIPENEANKRIESDMDLLF